MIGPRRRRFEQRAKWRLLVVVGAIVAVAGLGAWFLQSTIPHRIVLASGVRDGAYHEYAQRYKAILARDGVKVEERMTNGAGENAKLLLDPKSGVDVAFMQGGVVAPADRDKLVMIAALYYEPLWIFYRGPETYTRLDQLRYKRIAIGPEGSGLRVFVESILASNKLNGFNTTLLPLGNVAALQALQNGEADAVFFIGPVEAPAIYQALHDDKLKLLSLERAEAYARRIPYVSLLTLPSGTVDLSLDIPEHNVALIGTKAMLAARDDLPPAIVNLLLEAARELHARHGYFEANGEFPNTIAVDIPVSSAADSHHRFGPSLLHRYLPFFVATYVERLVILLVPLLVFAVPLINLLPQINRWRVRSRIYRWYGELALLERDVELRTGTLPIEKWLADIDRIDRAAAHIRTPAAFASEAYTLREHVRLVRDAIVIKMSDTAAEARGVGASSVEATNVAKVGSEATS